ncbi:MAG: hypothetical protein J1F20_02545 [Muribaculaceae bacterium]|nr:hypothetical protein [Muribaculaceae bacterium]
MKKSNILLALAAAAVITLPACSTRDTLEEVLIVGQEVPTCSWEVGSTVCKAGESFSFHGKYNIPEGRKGNYCEVWYRVMREESAAATVGLTGSSLSYTKTFASNDTMRAYQPIARYDHSQAEWTNHMFEIDGEVEVSRTLSPVSWVEVENWDADRYNSYYPANFAAEFTAEVINYLTKDSTYYNALRTVYINHPFTNEQFAEVNQKYTLNFPTDFDLTQDDQAAGDKSKAWFSTTTPSDEAIVGYYYTTVENGHTIIHEVGKDVNLEDGKNYYPVYDSAPWVFCRYNDDLGSIISTVRAEYIPAFKDLLATITFSEWIYDGANKVYKVDFSRKYSLQSQFRVYDSEGEEGIASDVREISVN